MKVLNIVKRISRIMAMLAVYVICAYGYLTAKGFVFDGHTMILSNPAEAKERPFSEKVTGEVGLSAERTRALGAENAPLTIFAYSSMSCAHCRDFHKFTLPKLKRDFIDQGKVRFIFIHFPIEVIAMRAAKLSYCLPNEKFYDFIDELYEKKDWLYSKNEQKLYNHAKEFGMTDADIEACNADKKLTSDILLVKQNAIDNFNILGTPSFIIEGKDGKEMILGTKNYDDFKAYLEKRLEGVK